MESPRLLTWRTEYISKIRKYREEDSNIGYLDETWFDNPDVLSKGWMDNSGKCCLDTPVSRGKRIIILHAGGTAGWVSNGLLLFAKNIQDSSADYHQDMDHKLFEQWFKNKLLTNIPRGSVIVMDNASYHSKGSTSTGRGKLVARKLVAATWTPDNWTHATIGRDENWTRENNYNM
jgi:hypothetical protein